MTAEWLLPVMLACGLLGYLAGRSDERHRQEQERRR